MARYLIVGSNTAQDDAECDHREVVQNSIRAEVTQVEGRTLVFAQEHLSGCRCQETRHFSVR